MLGGKKRSDVPTPYTTIIGSTVLSRSVVLGGRVKNIGLLRDHGVIICNVRECEENAYYIILLLLYFLIINFPTVSHFLGDNYAFL